MYVFWPVLHCFLTIILQDKTKTFLLRTKAVTPPRYIQETFEEQQIVFEEEPVDEEIVGSPATVKVEACTAIEDEATDVREEVVEETLLNENLFDGGLITKVFDEAEVFVNEVTIEDAGVKEEPLEISQE